MIKLKRRIGSAVLAVMMLLSLMPLTALAAGDIVAKIGDQEFNSLQAAIDAANNDNTILIVGEATGGATINKNISNLTIQGSDTGSIKDGSLKIAVGTVNVTGLTIQDVKFVNANIQASPNANCQLENMTIKGNTFFGAIASGQSAIHFNFGSTTGGSTGANWNGLTIEGNTITNVTQGVNSGILILGANTEVTNVTIKDNAINGTGWNGIQLNKVTSESITVSGNTIQNCAANNGDGLVNLYGTTATSFSVTGNKLIAEDGQLYLSNVADSASIDASNNYWGDGATAASIASGIGGSGKVSVTSYYTDEAMKTSVTVGDQGGILVSNAAQLQNAVISAKDGDVILVAPGNYNLSKTTVTVSSQTGWYLPITQSVTLQGVDENGNVITDASQTQANIYSTDYTKNGSWPTQNLITVFADDVTIEGLTIMNKVEPNKGIEVVGPVENFTVKNCTFAPISEDFWDNSNNKHVSYDEIKDFGSGIYFNGGNNAEKNISATITGNIFDRSGVSFGSVAGGKYTLTENTFSGVKTWDSYVYSSIGYTGIWTNPEGDSLGEAILTIQKNKFDDCGPINFSGVTDATSPNLSGNYWGENATPESIAQMIKGNVSIDTYYTDEAMTEEATIGGILVTPETDLQSVIDKASNGDTIILTPGTYDGNIQFGGKSLTIKAQYPAFKDGVKEADTSKLTEFTGTFNTFNTDYALKVNQTIVIDGFALSGDGLKIGNNNYNTVGNLEVRHCTMTFGKNLDNANGNNYAGLNYFVKLNGNDGAPYASVVVEDNYVSGTPVKDVYPIQLWDVDDVVVKDNVIDLTNAEGHQAINISKLSENAQVEVTDNEITGAGGGIYVTTWKLGSNPTNQAAKFTGTITVKDNTMTNVGSDVMEPIFLGYEKAATDSNPYGILTKDSDLKVEGNQNNGQPVAAVIGQPDGAPPVAYTVTVIDRDQTLYSYTVNAGGEITLPAAPSRAGYSFRGWYGNGHLYAAGEAVQITKDTTFVAQWSDNTPYYTITVKDADNGTVTCYAKSAAKGADVTLTVKADVGYQLDKLTVTDASGKTVAVEKVNNTTYTFVMPGSKVTVEAVFAPTTVEPSDLPFTDVSTSDWFYGAVKFVYENGLMDGVGNNLFAPNATLNRAMAVTILYRLEGSPAVTTDAGFNDVAAGIWYTDAVNWAAANNIVNGVEGNNFDPTGSLTREQMATVLYRYAQYKGADVSAAGDISGFADSANVSSWAVDAVKWAVGSGLVNGVEGNALAPQGTSTRAQAATVLMRFVG